MDDKETDRSVDKANQKDRNSVRGKATQKLHTVKYFSNLFHFRNDIFSFLTVEYLFA
jgi:hypothetical protein